MQRSIHDARILIVDDEPDNVALLRRILEADGYTDVHSTNDPRDVPALTLDLDPDLVLLDVLMPRMTGHAVLSRLREPDLHDPSRPVLVLTSDHSRQAQREAWAAGSKDFLTKPLSPSEVRMRVRNLLETRLLHLELREHAEVLEDRVRRRTADLEEARLQILYRLARAAEYRDDDTGQHTRRVGCMAEQIAHTLGLSEREAGDIRLAAPLHDVGKIGVPDAILLSAGRLSGAEFEVMQSHCAIGHELLSSEDVPLLACAAEIALTHHERWDGSGYPNGWHGEEIPLPGRIVAVADVFDALTHSRPYKRPWPPEVAAEYIAGFAGVQFDPAVVDAFVRVLDLPMAEVA
jgi:putative two-component system response regulator